MGKPFEFWSRLLWGSKQLTTKQLKIYIYDSISSKDRIQNMTFAYIYTCETNLARTIFSYYANILFLWRLCIWQTSGPTFSICTVFRHHFLRRLKIMLYQRVNLHTYYLSAIFALYLLYWNLLFVFPLNSRFWRSITVMPCSNNLLIGLFLSVE